MGVNKNFQTLRILALILICDRNVASQGRNSKTRFQEGILGKGDSDNTSAPAKPALPKGAAFFASSTLLQNPNELIRERWPGT